MPSAIAEAILLSHPRTKSKVNATSYAERKNRWAENKLHQTVHTLEKQRNMTAVKLNRQRQTLEDEFAVMQRESTSLDSVHDGGKLDRLMRVLNLTRNMSGFQIPSAPVSFRRGSVSSESSSEEGSTKSIRGTIPTGNRVGHPSQTLLRNKTRMFPSLGSSSLKLDLDSGSECASSEGESDSMNSSRTARRGTYEERSRDERLTNLHRRYNAQLNSFDLQRLQNSNSARS